MSVVPVKSSEIGAPGQMTVKLTPLPATPPIVTATFPVVAALGTGTIMLVALQLLGVPTVPLNVTVLVPCVAPKFVPIIFTAVPTGPDVGLRWIMMIGLGSVPPLLALEHPARPAMHNKLTETSRKFRK